MKTPIHILWFVWLIAVAPPARAQSPTTAPVHRVYVNGAVGDDANSGNSADQPLKTFAKAVTLLKPGSTLVIARTEQPYREPLILRRGGEANTPIIVEGNGAIIDLGEDVTAGPWKKDGERYVLDRDIANPGDLSQTAGAFIDGIPLGGVRSGQWKPGTMAYENGRIVLMPPAGKTPGTSRVILPRITASAVSLSAAHVIVRDLTAMHAGNDGFNLYGKVEGVRLQQVRALCNGDEGISAHQSAQVEVEDSEIAFNGSKAGGVADVDETVTTYRRCIVHHNRGSAFYFTTVRSQIIDCVSFDNGGTGLLSSARKGEIIVENSVDLSNAAAVAAADPRLKSVLDRAEQIRREVRGLNP